MTTALEVLDSAVKIGLGALITGAAAYWAGRDRSRSESRKAFHDARRGLLREVALEVGKSAEQLDEYMHFTHTLGRTGLTETLGSHSSLLLEGHKAAGRAQALGSLVEDERLLDALSKYSEQVEALHREFTSVASGAPYDPDRAVLLAEAANRALANVRGALAHAYGRTAA